MDNLSVLTDILLIAVFVLTVLHGIRLGLVRSVSRILSVFGAAFLASHLRFVLDGILQRYLFDPLIKGAVREHLEAALNGLDATVDAAAAALSRAAESLLAQLEGLGFALPVLPSAGNADAAAYTDSLTVSVAEPIAEKLSSVCAFLLLFVILYACFCAVFYLLAKVMRLPVLNSVNKLCGGIFGVLLGAAYMWLAAQVLAVLLGILCAKGILPAEVLNGPLFRFLTGALHTSL